MRLTNFKEYYRYLFDKGYVNFGLTILSAGLIFLVNVFLPLISDAQTIGSAVYIIAAANLIVNFVGFGYFQLLVRNLNLPVKDPNFMDEAKEMILLSLIFIFFLVLVFYKLSFISMSILYILVPVAYLNFLISYSKSIGQVEFSNFLEGFMKPLALPLAILILSLVSGIFELVYSSIIIIIIFIALSYNKKSFTFLFPRLLLKPSGKNIVNASNLMFVGAIYIFYSQSDIILVRNFLSEEDVTIFYLVTRISSIILIVFVSIKNKFVPEVAKLTGAKNQTEAISLLDKIKIRCTFIAIPMLLTTYVFSYFLETYVYSSEYQGLSNYVIFCSVAYFFSAFLGMKETLFIVTDSVNQLKYFYLIALIFGVSISITLFNFDFGIWSFLIGHCSAFIIASILISINSKNIIYE